MLRIVTVLILTIALLPVAALADGNNAAMKFLQSGFIQNNGQIDDEVEFYQRTSRGAIYFTSQEIVLDFKQSEDSSAGCVLRIGFEGANADPKVIGRDETPARFNYFRGNDPVKWRSDVPAYQEIVYGDVWPGIDLTFRQSRGSLSYEIQSTPDASPQIVEFSYEGADEVVLLSDDRVHVGTPIGILTNVCPGVERKIGFFSWSSKQQAIAGAQGSKDESDLVWCTYLGGTGADYGRDIARDQAGNLYVVGETKSTDFPTTPGAYDETLQSEGYFDVFVSKLDPSGSNLIYSTYVGGEDHNDYGFSIAVDSAGCGYIIGRSGPSFPTTTGAYDQTHNGSQDAFVAKLDSSGSSLVYSTFLGGDGDEHGLGIALDSDCCAYVTGATSSAGFPTTPGVFDSTLNGAFDVFVAKLNSAGSDLEYSTLLGGQYSDFGRDIAIESGNAFVTGLTNSSLFPTTPGAYDESWNGGFDAFVTRVNLTGSDLVYSSFLGGSESDEGYGVTVDGAGCAYVAGNTSSSTDFPTTPGAYDTTSSSSDLFVAKLDTWSSTLEYSTFLGGSDYDSGNPVMGLVTDSQGNAYVVGQTNSSDYPTTPGAYDQTLDGNLDICLSKLNSDGSTLLYSTYLGGANDDYGYGVAIDDSGSVYCTGVGNGGDFPTTPGAYDEFHNGFEDAFVAKIYTLETGTIAGTISGGRNPIEDAVVTASGPSTDADTTDPGGNYTIGDLSIGTYTVSVTAPGYYPDSQTDVEVTADDTTVVNFFLTRASGAIEGLVSTARGPIENAVVTADGEVTLADTTDPSGYYIIEELPTGIYDVTAIADGYDPRTKPGQEVVPDDTTTVDFNLDLQTGTFEGVVSGLGGFLTGAVVTAEGEYFGSDTTDINGQYLISALPTGNYDIYAYASEHHTGSILGAEIFAGDTTRVDFDLEPFNEHLIWSGFMGGDDDDEAPSLFVDYTGSVFVSGSTWSSNFPVTTGAYDTSLGGSRDAFIAKLNPETAGPFFVTFLGGSSEDGAYDIAVDGAGFPYVTGMTQSSDFPTTAGAYDETYNGDADAFVTKFHAGGNSLVYSTYLGGSGGEEGSSIAVGANGAYVTGGTWSWDFPTTPGSIQPSINGFHNDVFVSRIDASGSNLAASTYLGGTASDFSKALALDPSGNAYVAGYTDSDDFPTTAGAFDETYNDPVPASNFWDGFVCKMDLNMSTLSYSTYLGGGSNDEAWALAADNLGNAYVAGETNSEDFPVTPGAFDTSFVYDKAYVAKLNSSGASLGYCTFLGGSSDDEARGIAVDDSGYAYVAGSTDSPDFPTSEGAFDTTYCDSLFDAFLTRLGPSGRTLAYSTYLGGRSVDIGCAVALGGPRLVYVAGETESQDFPVAGFSTDKTYNGFVDVFVTRLDLPAVPATAAGEVGLRPERYALYRNYPNPFNPTTRISFSLPQSGRAEMTIHDISGRLVRTLSNDYRHAGEFSIYWNGRDDSGGEVSSGVYFVRLKAGDFEATRKVTLLK